MRERLFELIESARYWGSGTSEEIANYLLANGVMLVDTEAVDLVTNREPIRTAFGMPLDELAELIRAKQEGRTIVPPCKVGDTVYCIRYDKARKPFVKPLGVLSIAAYGKGKFTVFTTKEDLWCVTAFPTREEAEKALKAVEK